MRVCTYCIAAVKERPRRIQSCVVLRLRQLMVSFNDDLNPEASGSGRECRKILRKKVDFL